MIITREKGMRMWGGGSGSTSASGVNGGGGFSLAVTEGEGTGNAYTDFTYESGTLTLNKGSEFVTVDFFNKLFTAYDANGNVIAPNNTTPTLDNIKFKAGAWTEQYLSALGQNSSGGGGGGGIELSDVWQSLKTNTDDYANQKINSAHIPDLSGTYATKTWVNQQGFVTSSGVTSVAMTVPTGLSVSGSPITSTGTLALAFTSGYSIPTTAKQGNWDTAFGWGNHASAGYAMGTTNIIAGNGLTGGGTLAADRTLSIQLQSNSGLAVSSSGLKLDIINNLTTESAYKAISATQAKKIWDLLNQMFTLEGAGTTASPYVIKANYGLYTEQFLSALGQNSSGGGGGDFDEAQMWTALQSTSGTYATTKIATSHIPDMASTYGYLKASSLNGYATQAWVNQQGFLTTHQSIYALTLKAGGTAVTTFTPNSAAASLDFVAGSNISLTRGTNKITIANTYSYTLPLAASGTRGGVQIGYSESNSGTSTTRNYAVKLSSEKMYVNVPWTDTTYKLTLNGTTNGASDGTSLGSFYAPTASGTANQVLISGGANTAPSWTAQSNLKVGSLTTVSKKAWGQTYWTSGGVPQDVDGTLTISGGELMIWNTADTSAENRRDMRFGWTNNSSVFTMWAYEGSYHDLLIGTAYNAISANKGLYYDASEKRWGIGTTTPAYTFDVQGNIGATGAITLAGTSASTRRIYFGDTSHYIELTSTGFHFSHGIYSDSFVSALGANSSGGGSGTFDEEAMWEALGTTVSAKVIASNHIPNLAASKITSGTLAAARIPNLSASKITSGTFDTARIPDLSGIYYALYGGTNLNPSSSNIVDLDNLTSAGSYYCSGNAASSYVTNQPVGNLAFRIWVSAPNGTSLTYVRQRFQAYNQVAIYERVSTSDSGISWGNWYTVQANLSNYALTSSLDDYLPLSGGTITGSLTVNSTITTLDSIYMSNGKAIYFNDSGGTSRLAISLNSNNSFILGYGIASEGYSTYLDGNGVFIRYGTSRTTGILLNSSGNVGIGTISPSYKLSVNGDVSATNFRGALIGNADTSTTLATSRTIWGQSFDGSANVSGAFSGATTGAFSSNVTIGGTLSVTDASTLTGNITAGGDIYLSNAKYIRANNSSGTAEQLMGMNGSNQLLIGYGHRTSGSTILYGLSVTLSTNGTPRLYVLSNGNVGIANSSPSEKLHVTGNILASGEVTASSDERKKNIISDTKFNVRDIASARSILYEWNDDRDKDNEKKIHGGSIAQDWLGKADSFLSQDGDGWYSINYGALALCSAITIAKEVVKHEDRITLLEKENAKLKARVAELEERRIA